MTDATAESSKSFRELTIFGKLKFIGKTIIFFATFGFAFPTLFGQ